MNKRKKKAFDLSTFEKNLEHIKLAISDEEFGDRIKDIREHLNIPLGGFQQNEEYREWESQIYEKENKELSSESLHDHFQRIKERIKNDELSKKMGEEQYKLLLRQRLPLNYLKVEVDFLVDRYRLPRNFTDHVRRYIMTGEISAPTHNFTISHRIDNEFFEAREPRHVDVRIFTHLFEKDLKQLAMMVNKIFPVKLPEYKKLGTDIKPRIAIEEALKDRERKHMEQGKEVRYRVTAKEIAEEHLGSASKKNVNTVNDTKRDLHSTRKKRFGNK